MNGCEGDALSWFAFKVFWNKVFDIEEYLNDKSVQSYLPCVTETVSKGGVPVSQRRPVISSLIFFRSTPKEAEIFRKELDGKVMLFTRTVDSRREPAVIPDREMGVFMLVTGAGHQGLEYVGDVPEFRKGEHVRVIGGEFKGSEGYINRVRGDRRLVVSISGICAVVLTYIPQCFLEKVSE